MYIEINEVQFVDRLLQDSNANWSRAGAEALYEYLTETEKESGEQLALDIVALRCEWHEYDNAVEAAGDDGWVADSAEDKETNEELALDYLEGKTMVLETSTGSIVVNTSY